ncbi:CLUMA_CG010304, isoform A [Clunio marinus]|uniref:CLUMA_CG010304, isoform A n=1 Tax=Clunio marinus TaxID=568069 RepID=A0A1J1I9Y7_9DIPT|nr:CLUMA_CG010304, isoform A [Clunio marinus]
MVSCTILYNNSNGVFLSGQEVSGTITLYNEKVRSLRAIVMITEGSAETSWTEESGMGNDKSTTTYRGTETYINTETLLMGNAKDYQDFKAGHHRYNFSFRLPIEIPSSFSNLYGKVFYRIKVEMRRQIKFNYSFEFPFTVITNFDLNQATEELAKPLKREISKKFFMGFGSGALTIIAEIPISGYARGQTLHILVKVLNDTNIDVNKIIVEFKRLCLFKSDWISTKNDSQFLLRNETEGVLSKFEKQVSFSFEVPQVEPTTVENCKYIHLTYEVAITAKVGGMHRSPIITMPVTIGTVALSAMNDPIKQAIYDELSIILKQPGQKAEERLKQLKFTEGYGIYLAELTLDESLDLGLRQLSSVLLKKYVDDHWSVDFDEFEKNLPLASNQAKQAIKTILPKGLYSSNSKIRNTVAYTISTIAGYDWPSDWVELFDIIVSCLSGNEDSVHGAMQVLVEFTYELEERVRDVGPIILSEIYRIFDSEAIFTVKTRSCSVDILILLLKCINNHIEAKDQAGLLNPVLPVFLEKLVHGLTIPNGPTSDFNLKTEILRVFTYMISDMPKFIQPFISSILPPIWSLLTQMADIYVKAIVNEGEVDPFDGNSEEKSHFVRMILQIFELVYSIAESKRFKSLVKDVVGDLTYILILYMQITEDQIQTWSEDSEKFVEDEDEEGVDFNIRTSGHDILMCLGEEFEEKFLAGLTDAITKHVALADAERNSGRQFWWKTHEAAMLAVGSTAFKELILTHDKFNLQEYLNLVKGLLGYQVSPFLSGRCIYTLSKYIETESCAPHFADAINTTISSLESNKPITLRISAIRSVYAFCNNLKDVENDRKAFVVSKLEIFLNGILQIISEAQSTLMGLTLEALCELLAFDINFTASSASRVIPLVQALFLKYHDDRFILEHVQAILKTCSQNPFCSQPLQEKIVPTLVNILNLQDEQINAPMQDIALDVLETIVKYSKAPLSAQLIESAFPAAIHAILRSEDHSVMQSGGECLRAFLYVSPEQVCSYQNGQGLNNILQVTTMLLNPMSTEFSAAFIGRLVITLITKAGNFLGEQIDLLLKAVISKMQLVETLNVVMSLVMIFAHLFLIQMDAVMNFLSSVPGPTGEPAMNFVFTNWLSRQHLFYGTYERKVSVMALCKIFEYGVTTKDQRLMQVTIKDLVEVPNSSNKVRTRSQNTNKDHQWVSIPIMVKIFKLLINELSNLREFKDAVNHTLEDEDEDEDGDEDGSDEENPSKEHEKNLNAFMLFDEDESKEDDNQLLQDLMKDPIFQEDTEKSLTKFITNFSHNENFSAFVEQLTAPEKKLLETLRIEG